MNAIVSLRKICDYDIADPTQYLGSDGEIHTRSRASQWIKSLHLNHIPLVRDLMCKGDIYAATSHVKEMISKHLHRIYPDQKTYVDNVNLAMEAANRVNSLLDKIKEKRPKSEALNLECAKIKLSVLMPEGVPLKVVVPNKLAAWSLAFEKVKKGLVESVEKEISLKEQNAEADAPAASSKRTKRKISAKKNVYVGI